jgi:hypothetical protein
LNKWERTNDILSVTTNSYTLLYKNVSGGYATFKECYEYILSLQSENSASTKSGAASYVRELSDNTVR